MATRSEAFRAEAQRHRSKQAKKLMAEHEKKNKRVKRVLHAHTNERAAKKASYALETHAPGKRPSRKSTRGSANHAKSDSNFELRAERASRSPTRRARGGK